MWGLYEGNIEIIGIFPLLMQNVTYEFIGGGGWGRGYSEGRGTQ